MEAGHFVFEIAGPDRREDILQLRRAVYGRELGYGSGAVEWGPVDDRAFHLLALTEQGVPVMTMRLLGANARPFELETSLDLRPFLRPSHPPGEITRFCIASQFRRVTRGLKLHMGLMRLLYDACCQHQIDDVFICATPSAQKLYEFALYETLTQPDIRYQPLGDVPHLLMRLYIPTLAIRYRELNHPFRAGFEPLLTAGKDHQQ